MSDQEQLISTLLDALEVMVGKATKQNWNDDYPDQLQQAFDAIDAAKGAGYG